MAALTLCACSGTTATATTQAPGTGRAAPDPTDEVLAAYRGMWSDLVTAARTSDFQSPALGDHATGDALALFVRGLARDQLHDIVTRGEPVLDPSVTSLTPAGRPTRATVVDCLDDAGWIEYTTSGKRAENDAGGHRSTTAQLVDRDGTWKVSEITVGAVGTCS